MNGLLLLAATVSLHGLAPYANTAADGFWTTTGRVCTEVSQEGGTLAGALDGVAHAAADGAAAGAVEARVKVSRESSNAISLRTTPPGFFLCIR